MHFNLLGVKASVLLFMLDSYAIATKNGHCPPSGPVLPAPSAPSSHDDVKLSVEALAEQFKLFTGAFERTAVSIGVASIYEEEPILDLHHTPSKLDPRGVDKVDRDAVYRIGSISKIFTVLAALKTEGLHMDDPVTKYLPQLRKLKEQQDVNNHITTVDWDKVSLQALASHMAGIPGDLLDLASFGLDVDELGLPEAKDILECGGFGELPACNEKDFWNNFGKRPPIYPPGASPVYSNMAFPILSLVVEKVSGQSFDDFLTKNVFDVAEMTRSSLNKPDDSTGAISLDDSSWDLGQGFMSGAGGLYSSTKDLLSFGKSILTNKQLCAQDTNMWLKPIAFSSGIGLFAGAPWEIVRSDNITSDKRLVESYTKGGVIGTYNSLFGILPDYGLIFSMLSAGPESTAALPGVLASQIIKSLVPAVESAGIAEAEKVYAGKYFDKESNSTLVLETDDEGPGLNIRKWTVRGKEVPSNWLGYYPTGAPVPENKPSARLYPTGLKSGEGQDEEKVAWRAVVDIRTPKDIAEADALMFWPDSTCVSWSLVDQLNYEFKGLNEMVFSIEDGKTAEVDFVGFQTVLKRQD